MEGDDAAAERERGKERERAVGGEAEGWSHVNVPLLKNRSFSKLGGPD